MPQFSDMQPAFFDGYITESGFFAGGLSHENYLNFWGAYCAGGEL